MTADLPFETLRWLPCQRCNRIPADPETPVACRCRETLVLLGEAVERKRVLNDMRIAA